MAVVVVVVVVVVGSGSGSSSSSSNNNSSSSRRTHVAPLDIMSSWNSFYGGYVDRREENARKRQTPAGSERQDRSERLVQQLKEQTALLAKSEAG